MMSTPTGFSAYRGLVNVPTATPTNPAGQVLSDNFNSLADAVLGAGSGVSVVRFLGVGTGSGVFDISMASGYYGAYIWTGSSVWGMATDWTQVVELDGTSLALTVTPNISGMTGLTGLYLSHNSFTTAPDLTGMTALGDIELDHNHFSSAVVNAILAKLVAVGLTAGGSHPYPSVTLNNQSSSAPPTGQGITDRTTLVNRGWSVYTD